MDHWRLLDAWGVRCRGSLVDLRRRSPGHLPGEPGKGRVVAPRRSSFALGGELAREGGVRRADVGPCTGRMHL